MLSAFSYFSSWPAFLSVSMLEALNETVAFLQVRQPFAPKLGIILGTGLGRLIDELEVVLELPYDEIPNFPVSTVESHHGRLLFARYKGVPLVVLNGRFHYYEGYTQQQITLPVRVMKFLGIEKLLISNAAGALNPGYELSELMLLEDHISLLPDNPLRGKNLDSLGPRFPDMSAPYDEGLRALARAIASKNRITLHEGVYVAVPGPNLETRAEYRYLRIIGADAVGMSTVPEVIVARHMNLPVLAVSVLTDLCMPDALEPVDLPKILAAAGKAEPRLTKLFTELITQA